MKIILQALWSASGTVKILAFPFVAAVCNMPACLAGAQVLFGSLALVMVGVQHKSDRRDRSLHHGHWLVKAGLWALCNMLPFLLPNGVVAAYSWLARFGSPFFLLIQMIILLVGAAAVQRCPAANFANRMLLLLPRALGARSGEGGVHCRRQP
jgi:hypothetical protein